MTPIGRLPGPWYHSRRDMYGNVYYAVSLANDQFEVVASALERLWRIMWIQAGLPENN